MSLQNSEDINTICMICFDEDKPISKLKCGHQFCYSCVLEDYKSSNSRSCPYCRQDGGKILKKNDGQKFNSQFHNSESLYNFQEIELKSKLIDEILEIIPEILQELVRNQLVQLLEDIYLCEENYQHCLHELLLKVT